MPSVVRKVPERAVYSECWYGFFDVSVKCFGVSKGVIVVYGVNEIVFWYPFDYKIFV